MTSLNFPDQSKLAGNSIRTVKKLGQITRRARQESRNRNHFSLRQRIEYDALSLESRSFQLRILRCSPLSTSSLSITACNDAWMPQLAIEALHYIRAPMVHEGAYGVTRLVGSNRRLNKTHRTGGV